MFFPFFIGGYIVYMYSVMDLIMYYIFLLGCVHSDIFAISFGVISSQCMSLDIYMHYFIQNGVYIQNHNFL